MNDDIVMVDENVNPNIVINNENTVYEKKDKKNEENKNIEVQ